MKKLLLLGALLASTAMQAQTTYYWPGERVSELTPGKKYFIYNTAVDGDRSWFLYSNGSTLKTNNVSPKEFITSDDSYLFTTTKPDSPTDASHWYLQSKHGYVGIGGQTNNQDIRNIYINYWYGNETVSKGGAKSEDEEGIAQNPNTTDTHVFAITSKNAKYNSGDSNYAWNGNQTGAGLGSGWVTYQAAHPYAFYLVNEKNIDPKAIEYSQECTARTGIISELAFNIQKAYGLVKTGKYYYSNKPETTPAEHSSYANLIDGNDNTYFHSSWSDKEVVTHYLRAEITEPTENFYIITKRRCDNNNNRPTSILVEGSNDNQQYETIITLENLPSDANKYFYFSNKITANKAYKYIRFTPLTRNTDNQYFTYSEFYVIKSSEAADNAMSFAKALYDDTNNMQYDFANDNFEGTFLTAGENVVSENKKIEESLKYTIISQKEDGTQLGTQEISVSYGTPIALPSYLSQFQKPISIQGEGYTIDGDSIIITENASKQIIVNYSLLFKTTAIENGQFVKPTWYLLGMHNNSNRRYLKYHSGDNTIIDLITSDQTNPTDDSQLWCFSGSVESGFKIYNKQAGPLLSICYSNEYGEAGNKHAVLNDASSNNAVWNITQSTATSEEGLSEGFCFSTKYATDDYIYLNQRNTYLSYWQDAGNGSTFVINEATEALEELDKNTAEAFNQALNTAKQYSIGSGLGEYTDENGSFTEALNEAKQGIPEDIQTRTALTEKLTNATNALTINQPAIGKFYRFKSAKLSNYISSTTVGTNNRPVMTEKPEEAIFYLTSDKRLITENLKAMNNYNVVAALGEATTFKASKAIVGTYAIRNNGGSFYGKETNEQLDRWSDENGSLSQANCAWIIEEVTEPDQQPSLNQTIGSTGYATLAAPVALNIPRGVKAYTVTVSDNNTKANLNEITSGIIPAGCGVVLKAESPITESSSFNFTFNSGAGVPEITEAENALRPLYVDTKIGTDITAYILANINGQIGFYLLNADEANRTVGANKAYLVLPQGTNAVRSILFGGPTTGIENTVATDSEKEEYYDLQGRKVMNPEKGIYITKSGKKVIFTK